MSNWSNGIRNGLDPNNSRTFGARDCKSSTASLTVAGGLLLLAVDEDIGSDPCLFPISAGDQNIIKISAIYQFELFPDVLHYLLYCPR